jgi:hypothetical protein
MNLEKLLRSDGKLNNQKIRKLTKEEISEIEQISSEISSFNPQLKDRIKFLLLNPKNIYCSCGKPLKFSPSSDQVFKETCGIQSHIKPSQERIEKQKQSKNLTRNKNAKKIYTLEQQRNYILKQIEAGISPNYFFSKCIDIDQYIKQEAKKQNKKFSHYAYDILNNINGDILCSHCNTNVLSFISFEKGYRESCNNTYCRTIVSSKNKAKNKTDSTIKHLIDHQEDFVLLETPDINKSPWKIHHKNCGHDFTKWMNNGRSSDKLFCPKCELISSSKMEYSLLDDLKLKYSGEIIHRYKIDNTEIDIFVPEFNLGIELNGLHWHKDDSNKHLDKYLKCKEIGIELIQFTDLDFQYKYDIMISMILNKLNSSDRKYGARETYIDDSLSSVEYKYFCEKNHIKGYAPAKIRIGLRHKKTNELLTIFSVSKSRFSKTHQWELVRFCSTLNTNVIGALSKGTKYIANNIGSFETFADLHYGSGTAYEKTGYKFLYNTNPNYWYWNRKENRLESRLKYQKHKLPDQTMTEKEYTASIGLHRYYDCGNAKYSFEFKKL